MAVRDIDNLRLFEFDARGLGDRFDLAGRPDKNGRDQAEFACLKGPFERGFLAGMCNRGRDRFQTGTPPQKTFILSSAGFHACLSTICTCAAGSVSLKRKISTMAKATPNNSAPKVV